MGWLSHIYEAEYYYETEKSLAELSDAVKEAIQTFPGFAGEYLLITDENEKQKLFQRPGPEHSLSNAYHDREVHHPDLTVFATHSTRLFRFIDDLAFTFGHIQQGDKELAFIKTFSISRVGQGDLFQNRKNIVQIIQYLSKTVPFKKQTVFQQ
jgi:hypothetical protein